jgi:hypothetical protein
MLVRTVFGIPPLFVAIIIGFVILDVTFLLWQVRSRRRQRVESDEKNTSWS